MRARIERPSTSPAGARAGSAIRRGALLPLLLLPMLSASPADAAASPAGPSSSATVHIILSVAPRLDLKRVDGADGPNSAGYCIGGNIGRGSLPVHLLWPSIGESGSSAAGIERSGVARAGTEINWCGGETAETSVPHSPERTGLALISPE